ncbi:hypothetical protein BTM25_48360 [Actinomadura rubteroloni]|uniref:Uncharacterized protein n=1 Tax=Actinomadura rubteroloni TaxID=1926885 RepID=A0A2P4UF58_9ACTN|nr:hypothetical protein BTM25_48360 [Actinomadura rubteroloni]
MSEPEARAARWTEERRELATRATREARGFGAP